MEVFAPQPGLDASRTNTAGQAHKIQPACVGNQVYARLRTSGTWGKIISLPS